MRTQQYDLTGKRVLVLDSSKHIPWHMANKIAVIKYLYGPLRCGVGGRVVFEETGHSWYASKFYFGPVEGEDYT